MNVVLVAAGAAALVAGLVVALPAWRASRARTTSAANQERYLAWRGRADRVTPPPALAAGERNRLLIGAVLAILGVVGLVIGLSGG